MSSDDPDINEIIAHAALQKIEDLTKPVLDNIRNTWLRTKTRSGFTPTPDEAYRLKKIGENRIYLAFKSCVGSTPYLRFIKVGILLYELMQEGNLIRIKSIKDEIYNSRYNKDAIKIIHIASTGVLLNTLEYLINLRDERNLSKYAVSLEFEKILLLWQQVSVDINKNELVKDAENKIMEKLKEKPPLMIVYASQKAVPIAQAAIADIRNNHSCAGNYLPWSKNLVYYGLEQFLCVFYNVEGEWDTPFG